MKKIIYIITFITLSLFSSCEKEIKFNDQDSRPRIVLHSFMNETDTLICIISQSVSVLDPNNYDLPKIGNAEVKLYENGIYLGDFLENFPGIVNEEGVYYFPNINPTPGSRYKIVVSHPNFETVQGEFIFNSPILNLNIDTTISNNKLKLNFSFIDNASEENYYGIVVEQRNVFLEPDGNGNYDTIVYYMGYTCTKDIIFLNGYQEVNGEKCTSEFLFTDKNLNGSNIKFNLEASITELTDTVKVFLFSYSEGMFKNKLSLEKYNNSQGDFFAEPVQVYTNIENGYGIFGGSSVFEKTIVIIP